VVTLAAKLGLKPGHRVALLGSQPLDPALISSVPVHQVAGLEASLDVIVFLTDRTDELVAELPSLKAALAFDGGLWVGWPKKASKRPTDLTFEVVQALGLAHGLVDNKVCSIDDVWSGLRFVYRKADRPQERL
jgi:hypothetical protein